MAKKSRSAIALEVERIYECADNDEQAVQQVHNYLVTSFNPSAYTSKVQAKATIEQLLQPYALELVESCASGVWEELERISKQLEKVIILAGEV